MTDFTINCKGKLIDLSTPKIMGIVNCSADSFYTSSISITDNIDKMVNEGVDILDIGGMSSKPDASYVSFQEEMSRLTPTIEYCLNKYSTIPISIDTFRSSTAKECITMGASIINDISAGDMDQKMLETVAKLQVPYIAMHMKGTPQTMQQNPTYNDITTEILDYFIKKINQCFSVGIKDMILDVGFGFGKTVEHNFELLKTLHCFKILEKPLLVGISRKSMIYKALEIDASQALNGTSALHMVALQQGANILRVHDVKEAKECVTLYNQLQQRGQ